MNRQARHNRDWLLLQHLTNPDVIISLTAYLQTNQKNPNWITFTQVENKDGQRISGHINLPSKIILNLQPEIFKKGNKKFVLHGKPSFYLAKGNKRGALLIQKLEPV